MESVIFLVVVFVVIFVVLYLAAREKDKKKVEAVVKDSGEM
jgi:hypothetical protein